jgi:hypothetical protein
VEAAPPSTASISPPLARAPALAPAAGLRITSPTDDARVPARVVVKGSRALPIDPELQAWLFVRAELEGSKWYPYPRALEAGRNGRWEAELELGGPAGLRHELRVGTLDPASHQELLEQLAEHPNEALDALPAGFAEESSLVVTKR